MAYVPDYGTSDLPNIFANGLGILLLVITQFLTLIVLIVLVVWAIRTYRKNK